jgi:hypothetical protein
MKKSKLVLSAFCIAISLLGITNLASDNSFITAINQLKLISSAQAEMLPEVIVQPCRGNPDTRSCTIESTTVGYPGGISVTISTGIKTICLYDNDDYCDYVPCH